MSTYHIINDPIHGIMSFSEPDYELLKPYLDSSNFQRLRRIKQLGCGDLIFPGAVHTRFNHSLGACYIASKVCRHLEIKDIHCKQIKVAALLHDVGHGPFSHAFEKMYKNLSVENNKFQISHDYDWTPKFINSFEEVEPGFNKDICSFFVKNATCEYKDLISSQLDVDRLDYLLRDSHFCGVPYGNIDLKWIISCLKLIGKEKKLGIHAKGIGAIEHYIFSRRLMTKNIYYHGKKNAAEYLIREFLLGLSEHLNDEGINRTPLLLFMKQYFDYVEQINGSKIEIDKDTIKRSFIDDSFSHYCKITDDDIWSCMRTLQDKTTKSGEIAKKLINRDLPKCYLLDGARVSKAKEIVKDKVNKSWKVYLDTLNFEAYKSKNCPIYIDEPPAGSDIYYESSILNHLSDKSETTYFLYLDKSIERDDLLKSLSDAHCLSIPYVKGK